MNTPTDLCPWLADTHKLLANVPRQIHMTEIANGSGVPIPWLSKFQAGKFKSPNIIYVYRLHQYLTNQAK